MHRNTYILIIFLSIFAALVAGVNIGKSMSGGDRTEGKNSVNLDPTPSTIASAQQATRYIKTACGVQLQYPVNFALNEEASTSAVFVRSDDKDYIILTCQKDIQRPPSPKGNVDTIQISNSVNTASISASIYHDSTIEEGSKMDVLIFYNPTVQKDVFLAGYGPAFNATLKTVRILP